ncbi:phosphoinositide phosphatase SAC8 isoform X2 [Rosa chinensis]|uniref:phosphoinositide phosphatase SAC8 isoform X2 n=1 Tax=Rosa chinensis TaxID=74649 RepID=UPI001AD92112|nr:phosphoinositide phosphatase SAC8 isoform X2 [Rosa chinensis]
MDGGSSSSSSSSSGGNFKLYEKLELQEFPDKFVVKSVEAPDQGFVIARRDGTIEPLDGDSSSASPSKTSTIYGVVGTIRLLAGNYLLVITSRIEVGNYLGFPVYRVTSMKFLSCNEVLKLSTAQEKKDEAYFMALLKTVQSTPGLYFSYETDLTLNFQRRRKLIEGWMAKPLWKQADPRFVWNKNLLDELIEFKLDGFIIPLLQGSFQTTQLKLKDLPVALTIFSRRCTRRLGTRMWRRGANLEGDVANFIETEQLAEFEGFKSSLLQSNVVERHFHDLFQRYGETIAVDLTDKHGDEGELSKAFANETQNLPNVRYVPFDFHHICGNSNFENLKVLYEQLSELLENQGYFLVDAEGNILEDQKGIVRSNCIDCLDRTNVTQSYLAQKCLDAQLQRMGVLDSTESISVFDEEYQKFRTLWAEHGDEISLEYAGTYALKGDLVRYGKQTFGGMIRDGMSALSRYYLNNFQDGIRQDAADLISGHYTVRRDGSVRQMESFSYLPVASALLIGGLTLTSFTLQQAGRNAHQFMSSVLWAGMTAGLAAVVKANGRQFCSRPRLCRLV